MTITAPNEKPGSNPIQTIQQFWGGGVTPQNLQKLAQQMLAYQQAQFGSISNLNAYQKAHGGETFASWDAVLQHMISGKSPIVTSILTGKLSYSSWQATTQTEAKSVTGTPSNPSSSQRDAYATLLSTLNEYGLGSLGNWLWQEITNDVPESQIFIDLRNQDAYKKRFPGIVARQKEGLPAISEADYIQTEDAYRTQLMRLGVPVSQTTDPKAFLNYFVKDVSPNELQSRVDLWESMTSAPGVTARIKGLFEQYAGVKGASNADLYKAIIGDDTSNLAKIAGTTFKEGNFTTDQLQNEFKKAIQTEAATFRGGGGVIAEQQGIKQLGGAEQTLT